MRRLVPDYILTRYAAGRRNGAVGAAAVSVDVVGFSEITDALARHGQHGAEVVASLMREVFEPLIDETQGHGGFVVGFSGDSLTAVFPEDECDDIAVRAGAAALGMVDRVPSSLGTEYGSFAIDIRVGGALGDVTWAVVEEGDPVRAMYYVRGSAIDESAALQQAGRPGRIVTTAELAAAMGSRARFDGDTLINIQDRPPHIYVPPTPADAAEHLSRFFPDEVLDHPDPGEFRQVVSVFVRLGDHHAEQLDDVLRSALRLHRRHGGLISRMDFGDKGAVLVAFWGAPVAHENDVLRAVDFVLDLRDAVPIPVSAGVTYGTTHAGFIGTDERDEYTSYGTSTNLAARLMVGSQAGEVRVEEAVAERIASEFSVVELGKRRLKGFDEAMPVFGVTGRSHEVHGDVDIPLVGRTAEVDQLESFIAGSGDGGFLGVAVLRGEAGLGKTRIVHELVSHLASTTTLFFARCDETVRDPLNPVIRWLRDRFEVSTDDDANRERFDRLLNALVAATPDPGVAGELRRTQSVLGTLVGLSWQGSLLEGLSSEGQWENTVIAVETVLRAESYQRPVVFILEDVQWIDESTRRLLAEVVRYLRIEAAPVAILATSRPSETDPLGSASSDITVEVGALDASEVAELAALSLGGPMSPEVGTAVVARAEGNPFFVQELVQYLRTTGAIHESRGAWRFTPGGSATRIPGDVRAVLAARLDTLDRDIREVILAAAVLGSDFDSVLVAAMLDRPSVDDEIAAAIEAGFLIDMPGTRSAFRQALVRDAAYEMQALARRRVLHQRAVQAIEDRHGSDNPPPSATLAYHADKAGLTWQAAAYHSRAAEQAVARYANEEAIQHYSRVLVLTPDTSPVEHWDALMGIEAALHILGWRDDQRDVVARLDQLVGSMGRSGAVDLALRKADLAADLGDYAAAVVEARSAVDMARSIGDQSRLAAALIVGARHEWRSTHDAAVTRQLDEAIEIAVGNDDAVTEADARVAYGVIASEQDRYDEAAVHYRIGLERAREAGDRRIEGWALNSLGLMRLNSGDLEAARAAFNASLEVRREIGHRLGETGVVINLAMIDEIEGHYADAVVANQRAIVLCDEIGDRYNLGWSLNNLGLLWAMLGRTDEARRVGLETLRVGREIGEATIEANALSNLSLLEHQLGNDVEALERARAALTIAETAHAAGLIAETLTNQGHALVALDDLSGAEASYRRAIEIRNDLGDLTGVAESLAGIARIDLHRGDVAAALRSVEPILDVISSSSLEGTYEPFRIYLTCVEVLTAAEDPRSRSLLAEARGELMARAEGIDDVELRSSFLDGVPSHRALLESSL